MSTLGKKYTLGTYARGAHVQLGEHLPPIFESLGKGRWATLSSLAAGEWVTVVNNYAHTTGVVVVKSDRTGAIYERDGRSPLFDLDLFQPKHVVL